MREDSVLDENVTSLDCDQTEDLKQHKVSPSSSEAPHCTRSTETSEHVVARPDSVSAIKTYMMPSSLHRTKNVTGQQESAGASTASPLSTAGNKRGFYCRSKRLRRARKVKSKWWPNVEYVRTAARFSPADVTMQPDLEDVDGMLFVSFSEKEALDVHVVNMRTSVEVSSSLTHRPSKHSQCDEGDLPPLENIISQQELMLMHHLKQQKNRQIIHPSLQDVGLKLNLLDPTVPIDLKYLGVCLTSSTLSGLDDFPISSNSIRRSAFLSDMLDEYLASEAQTICERAAVFSTSSPSPVIYQLPVKSSSYVRTLDSVFHTRCVAPSVPANSCNLPDVLPSKSAEMTPVTSSQRSRQTNVTVTERDRLKPRTSGLSPQDQHPAMSSSVCFRQEVKNRPGRHVNSSSRVIGGAMAWSFTPAKKQMKMLEHEQDAIFHGRSRTFVTAERAKFALNSLLTSKDFKTTVFSTYRDNEDFCGNDFCHLGCVCGSLNRKIRGPTHCRRLECMFGCNCFKHKVFLIHPPQTDQMQKVCKMPLLAFPVSDPELNCRPDPAPTVTTLWRRRKPDDGDDPEGVLTPPAAPALRAAVCSRVCVPRPNSDVIEMKKDPVYVYLESKMTCARVREYNSNPPPQLHILPAKKNAQGPDNANNKVSQHLPVHLVSPCPDKNPAVNTGEPTKVLEIISECNWEAHRTLVLKKLYHCINMGCLSSSIFINNYKVDLLSTTLQRNKGSCTINYKVCVSFSKKLRATNERRQGKKRGLNNSATQQVNRSASKQSISNNDTDAKSIERLPLLSRVVPAGSLKAIKKTSGCPCPVQVNGKTYTQAKLFLGQMGALHPANRLAGYVTGRLKQVSVNQTNGRSVLETLPLRIPVNLRDIRPPVIPTTSGDTRQTQSVVTSLNVPNPAPPVVANPSLTPDYITSSNPRLIPNVTPISVPPLQPIANPNLVAPPNPEAPSKPDVVLPAAALPPGQQVVLQPVPGVKGASICQFNGQMIQLVPLPAVLPIQLHNSSSNRGKTQQKTQIPSVLPQMIQPTVKTPEQSTSQTAAYKPLPFIGPKILSLPGTTSFSFTSGTTAHGLQNACPGKVGMFSFRVCPPTGDQTGQLPDAGKAASTVLLPGGYRIIKLPVLVNPYMELINTENSQSSVPLHLINRCLEKSTDISIGNSEDCESACKDSTQGVSIQKRPFSVCNAKGKSENAMGRLACDVMCREATMTGIDLLHAGLVHGEHSREILHRETCRNVLPPVASLILRETNAEQKAHNVHCPEEDNAISSSQSEVANEGQLRHESSISIKTEPTEIPAELHFTSAPNAPKFDLIPKNYPQDFIKIEQYNNLIQTNTSSRYHGITELGLSFRSNSDPVFKTDSFDNPPNTDTLFHTQPDNTEQFDDPNKRFVKIEPCDETSEMDQIRNHPEICETFHNPVNNSSYSVIPDPLNNSQQGPRDNKAEICKWLFKEMHVLTSSDKDTEKPGDDCNTSVDGELSSSNDDWTTEDSDKNCSEEDIDIETIEENNEKMNICQLRASGGRKDKKAGQHRLRDEWGHDTVEHRADLCLYKRAWFLNHAEKRRQHHIELEQHFDSLRRILNIEEHIKMSVEDILLQACHVIGDLEHHSRSLMEKKSSLIQKQSSYVALISRLSGGTEHQRPQNASRSHSVTERPSSLPRVVLQAFTKN